MPQYHLICKECNWEERIFCPVVKRDKIKCSRCGGETTRPITSNIPRVDNWPNGGITLDHVAETPQHFNSRKERDSYLRKKGFQIGR